MELVAPVRRNPALHRGAGTGFWKSVNGRALRIIRSIPASDAIEDKRKRRERLAPSLNPMGDDMVTLYTDGTSDSMELAGSQLGPDDPLKLIWSAIAGPPVHACRALLSGERTYRATQPRQYDEGK